MPINRCKAEQIVTILRETDDRGRRELRELHRGSASEKLLPEISDAIFRRDAAVWQPPRRT